MVAFRQIISVTGLIAAVVLTAASWKIIHIGPALEKGLWIGFVTTLLAVTVVDWIIYNETRS